MSDDKKKPEKLDAKAHESERGNHKEIHLERVAAVSKLADIKIPKFEPAKPATAKAVHPFKSPMLMRPPKEEA